MSRSSALAFNLVKYAEALYLIFLGVKTILTREKNLLRGNLKFLRAQCYFAGSVYFGLGLTTALTGTSKK